MRPVTGLNNVGHCNTMVSIYVVELSEATVEKKNEDDTPAYRALTMSGAHKTGSGSA